MDTQTKFSDLFRAGRCATSNSSFLPSDLWLSQFSPHIALHIKACTVETTKRAESMLVNYRA